MTIAAEYMPKNRRSAAGRRRASGALERSSAPNSASGTVMPTPPALPLLVLAVVCTRTSQRQHTPHKHLDMPKREVQRCLLLLPLPYLLWGAHVVGEGVDHCRIALPWPTGRPGGRARAAAAPARARACPAREYRKCLTV